MVGPDLLESHPARVVHALARVPHTRHHNLSSPCGPVRPLVNSACDQLWAATFAGQQLPGAPDAPAVGRPAQIWQRCLSCGSATACACSSIGAGHGGDRHASLGSATLGNRFNRNSVAKMLSPRAAQSNAERAGANRQPALRGGGVRS